MARAFCVSSHQLPACCSVRGAPVYLSLICLSTIQSLTYSLAVWSPISSAVLGSPHLSCSLPLSLPAPNPLPPCSRIYEILPQRIQQWQQSPCIAEEHGKKLLERIRREQQSARTRLQEMERRFHELEAIILRAKQQAVREDEEVSEHRPSGPGPSTRSCLASLFLPLHTEQ